METTTGSEPVARAKEIYNAPWPDLTVSGVGAGGGSLIVRCKALEESYAHTVVIAVIDGAGPVSSASLFWAGEATRAGWLDHEIPLIPSGHLEGIVREGWLPILDWDL